MNQDSGVGLTQLQVDGGMTANQLLMQLQADILHIPVGEDTPLNSAQFIIVCRCLFCVPYLGLLLADLQPLKPSNSTWVWLAPVASEDSDPRLPASAASTTFVPVNTNKT